MPRTISVTPGRAGQLLRTYACFDFSGGLDIVSSPMQLAVRQPQNRLIEATNIVYNIDGSVSKRWGTERLSDIGSQDDIIDGGHLYRKSDGTALTMVGTRDGRLCKLDGSSLVSVGATSGGIYRWAFTVFHDTLFIAANGNQLVQYDGTTYALADPSGGLPLNVDNVTAHANRLFATSPTTPSRLYWSKLNNPNDWTGVDDAGFLDVNPEDGGVLKALVPSIQELALLKTWRPYRLQGIGPVTGYTVANSLAPATGSIGAITKSAAVFAANDVWYMSQVGVHRLMATDQFGDLTSGLNSDPIEPFFRYDTAYQPYGVDYSPNFLTVYQAIPDFEMTPIVCHDVANNLLIFGQCSKPRADTPLGYIGVDRLLVYDMRIKAWSMWRTHGDKDATTHDFPGEFTYLWPSTNHPEGSNLPEICMGLVFSPPTPAVSAVAHMRRGILNDDWIGYNPGTVPIRSYVTHLSALNAPTVRKCPRHLFLYFAPVSASTTITVEITYDLASSPQVTTSVDLYAPGHTEARIVKRLDLGQHLCDLMAIRVSNAGLNETFRWLGYEVQWSARRSIRRTE